MSKKLKHLLKKRPYAPKMQYAHKKIHIPCVPTGYYVYKTGKYTPSIEDKKHDALRNV